MSKVQWSGESRDAQKQLDGKGEKDFFPPEDKRRNHWYVGFVASTSSRAVMV